MADKPQFPPTIELDGARLRPLRVADADALYAYLRDPVVTELTSYPVASVPMVEAMIERCLSRWAAGELSKWGALSSTMISLSAPADLTITPRYTAGRNWHTTWRSLTGALD